MVEAGRRRKEQIRKNAKNGGSVIEGGHSCETIVSQPLPLPIDVEEPPAINLEVVLPLPGSGINHVLDLDGASAQDSTSDRGGVAAAREEEAKILIDIQHEVGFTFENGEEEIQSKLIELEKIDYEKKIVREQKRGYQ
jgi:predicted sugar kinase